MKSSVKLLRESYQEYLSAKQARYDELVDDVGRPDPYSNVAMSVHKAVVSQISREQNAVAAEKGEAITSAPCYITKDGEIWTMG